MFSDVTVELLPIYEVASGRLHGFEARARGPDGSHFRELYDSAKRDDDLAELDRRCLRAALLTAGSIETELRLFVNVFASSVAHGAALAELSQTAARPEQVVLQIGPDRPIVDESSFSAAASRFVELGGKLSLDGFGTGYSTMSQLSRMPLHYLAADESFVAPDDPVMSEMLHAMGGMARGLELQFLVPGVDSQAHLSAALAAGAELVRGVYLGVPTGRPLSSPVLAQTGA